MTQTEQELLNDLDSIIHEYTIKGRREFLAIDEMVDGIERRIYGLFARFQGDKQEINVVKNELDAMYHFSGTQSFGENEEFPITIPGMEDILYSPSLIQVSGMDIETIERFYFYVIRQIAVAGKLPTAVFSMRNSAEYLYKKLFSVNEVTTQAKTFENHRQLSEGNIFIIDSPFQHVCEIRAMAYTLIREYYLKTKFIVIDDLLSISRPDGIRGDFKYTIRALSDIASRYALPILLVSYFGSDESTSGRYEATIAQYCDVALRVYPVSNYPNDIYVNVMKNDFGPKRPFSVHL